jgi:outer membrane biosynthesis protein TonB
VARRRQIPPGKLAAKEVVLRFTVEPDGRVRDAEAVSAPDTDLEVAACAKRVLSEWVFARHHGDAIAVQRTYRFR